MQLYSINISNLLSFPYQQILSEEKKIYFDTGKKGWLNILIGPNWSGKTNFLEIITQLIKVGLIKDFIYKKNTEYQKESILENSWPLENMIPHFSHQDKPSTVELELYISNNDKENMLFLQKERDKISKIIQEYSKVKYEIPVDTSEDIKKIQSIKIKFDIDTKNKIARITNKQKTKSEEFALYYIIYQELFQLAIMIYNNTKKESELWRYPLKNTFWQLYNTRNFYHLKKEQNQSDLREKFMGSKNYRENNSLLGYSLCIKKINNILQHTAKENRDQKLEKKQLDTKEIESRLNHSLFYNSLRKSIKKYLNLELKTVFEKWEIEIYFTNSMWQQQNIHSISNGEQSLLTILFTIYWFDLKQGLLIIDEPELHFHPQMQRRLSKMLEKLSQNIGTQCIISTYSPIFINEKNITNVYRFNKNHGETNIRMPDKTIGQDESSLIQILKFENAAKIFFVDKIIMVEGEIDAYFFEYYLQYLHNYLPNGRDKITNYEIININGKGSYKKRSTFLKKFWIESYFIGDRDNIVDYGFISQQDLNHYYKQAKNLYQRRNNYQVSDYRHYAKVVNAIKQLYPNKYSYILEKIKWLYARNVFILSKGDIETYLSMPWKWLEETINFCHNEFTTWLNNKSLVEHKKELEYILWKIFEI
jgi:putative ATP-dependent endonuclease of the OLD family